MIGKAISHYKILEKLGEGGMGVVYRAEDTKLKRTVALKFLPPDLTRDPEAKERFIHEAQAASALDHPNICTVHDINETDDGQLFMAMAYYDGETLKKKIERGPLPVDLAVGIALQVARGLAKAHESGIVHRDIKPANVIVSKDGIAKILDFGLAKLSGRTMLTKAGSTMGTAAYMSPEQARGELTDARTDIWSLGVVLYEMLSGKPPFPQQYEQAVIYAILNEKPEPVGSLRGDIPPSLQSVLGKMLEKDPARRYQHSSELLYDLELVLGGGPAASSRMRRPLLRSTRILALLAAALVLAGAAYLLTRNTRTIESIAVLPFVDLSENEQNQYLFDGLTERVIQNLGQSSLFKRVIAFNGVARYRKKEIDPVTVGKELGVDALVISRARLEGEALTVDIEILDARETSFLWGKNYVVSMAAINRFAREIALAIPSGLGYRTDERSAIGPAPEGKGDPEAYRLYLQGNYHYHLQTKDELSHALSLFRKAILRDPDFAPAYAGMAISYAGLSSFLPWEEIKDSAMNAALRALELDNTLAEAQCALATFRWIDYQWQPATEALERAIQLNPSYADAYHYYAHVLSFSGTGKSEKAIQMIKRAIDLDPATLHFQECLAFVNWDARRWDDALQAIEKLAELDSTRDFVEAGLGMTYAFKGMRDESLDHFRKLDARTPDMLACWLLDQNWADLGPLFAYGLAGDTAEARKYLKRLEARSIAGAVNPMDMANAYAVLGERELMLKWLHEGRRAHAPDSYRLKTLPWFDRYREDPEFKSVLKLCGF
jgi:serine/threonine protein kinase